MTVSKGKMTCVSITHIIGGTLMAVCGALQGIRQLKYMPLDSLYAGIWVGIWMIFAGVTGIIAKSKKESEFASAFVIVFMIFSIISTTLGLEIVGYYTYTFAASWDVYRSSSHYLIIAFATYLLAILQVILGIIAAIFGHLENNQVGPGEGQLPNPQGYMSGTKQVFKNHTNEVGFAKDGENMYYYKITKGPSVQQLPQGLLLKSKEAPQGYRIENKVVYQDICGQEWEYSNNGGNVVYYPITKGQPSWNISELLNEAEGHAAVNED